MGEMSGAILNSMDLHGKKHGVGKHMQKVEEDGVDDDVYFQHMLPVQA